MKWEALAVKLSLWAIGIGIAALIYSLAGCEGPPGPAGPEGERGPPGRDAVPYMEQFGGRFTYDQKWGFYRTKHYLSPDAGTLADPPLGVLECWWEWKPDSVLVFMAGSGSAGGGYWIIFREDSLGLFVEAQAPGELIYRITTGRFSKVGDE